MAQPANPWRKHYQLHFRALAADTDRPLWDRLAMLAYASARANGHANYKPSELAAHFGVSAQRISDNLKIAKDKGLIALDSKPTCLRVPAHIAEQGVGNEYEACGVHDARRLWAATSTTVEYYPIGSEVTHG